MKWNEEEIRAAIEKVAVKYSPHIESSVPQLIADGALAELTKPAIHPDVFAVYDHLGSTSCLSQYVPNDATNIRPLVPVEAVQKWASDWYYGPVVDDKSIEEYFAARIAHYLTTGETDE